jgi:hypothetical protein
LAVQETCLEVIKLDPREPADLGARRDPETDLDRVGDVVADAIAPKNADAWPTQLASGSAAPSAAPADETSNRPTSPAPMVAKAR